MAMAEEQKRAEIEPGSELADLASMLGTVNRIADRLQQAASKVEASLSVNDWLFLRALKDEGDMAGAARKIGLSRQRVHQRIKPLTAAGLIAASNDNFALTPKGTELMETLEKNFEQALKTGGGAMPTVPLHGAKLSVRRVLKAMAKKDAA
jgi:DNA-binding MarR family transcriptional regulator